ncbi:flagellar export protein FliJ [Nocardioidaceae bacterium]|nr:flagellar export protein FliJ [Nocardioidaceae bacterium]
MSTRMHTHDRGLHAVRRVRAAREEDSHLGLARAVAEQQEREATVVRLTDGLRGVATTTAATSATAYAVHHAHLVALGERLGAARAEARAAARVVDSAREHWIADHRRLESVDGLLERRREQRAEEASRRAAREDDETAATLWRRTTARSHGGAS